MPFRARRHALSITLKPFQLIICIALGLWLGFAAIALTVCLVLHFAPQATAPLSQAVETLRPAPVQAPQQPAAADNPMFERYKEILRKQEVQQAEEQMESNPRNLSNPKCQFWLQQNRTAPTDKSRANVLEFCN
ncbi:hypothetical protein [Pseudomonas defluvii]|uniref:hypothetical protein n=1 Tax=Pseudomonas defluvii TaxID=1876757 RepID=UPI003905DB3B